MGVVDAGARDGGADPRSRAAGGDVRHAPSAEGDAVDAVFSEIDPEILATYASTESPAHAIASSPKLC